MLVKSESWHKWYIPRDEKVLLQQNSTQYLSLGIGVILGQVVMMFELIGLLINR